MLRASEDKHHHAELERKIFAEIVRIALETLDRYVDEDIAQNAEEKETCEVIAGLDGAHRRGLFRERRGASRQARAERRQACSNEIAEPDHGQSQRVGSVVLNT